MISPEDLAYLRSIRCVVPSRRPSPDWHLLDDAEVRPGGNVGKPAGEVAGRVSGNQPENGSDRKGEAQ